MKTNVKEKLTVGQRLADVVADIVGSWTFIFVQSSMLVLWMAVNVIGFASFDPYPFILLNLALSFQAAYTGPFVMMSQARQAAKDRATIEEDLRSDLRAEKHIKILEHRLEELHTKIDELLQHQHHNNS